jgi:hypothetical protein
MFAVKGKLKKRNRMEVEVLRSFLKKVSDKYTDLSRGREAWETIRRRENKLFRRIARKALGEKVGNFLMKRRCSLFVLGSSVFLGSWTLSFLWFLKLKRREGKFPTIVKARESFPWLFKLQKASPWTTHSCSTLHHFIPTVYSPISPPSQPHTINHGRQTANCQFFHHD